MIIAKKIIEKYIAFFEKRGHKQIPNAPLVPENDPTTLFTNSGMQPLVPYLLGEKHPQGKKLVNVQNCFRAQDIDEIGDNRHTTFFRMLGNWSLGGYFKKEQLSWFFEFLIKELNLPLEKLYVSVFQGYNDIYKDTESENIWQELFINAGINPKNHIFFYGASKNWWSRAGAPENMPAGEPGGPDSEVFFDFETPHNPKFGKTCHINCDCGRYLEIGNSVFMQYQKQESGSFKELPQKNVDFGGGLERLLAACENKQDVFQTSLFYPIIKTIETQTAKEYEKSPKEIRVIADHLIASCFMISNGVTPSNTEQGYILRRLLRRAFDNFDLLDGKNIYTIIETIAQQYKETDPVLENKYEKIRYAITEEEQVYRKTLQRAKAYIVKQYSQQGDELIGVKVISAEAAFVLYSTHGLSPSQIKSLGFTFNDQEFAKKMEEHQALSRSGAAQKFAGGLADHSEKTIMGHTATHLLHQAIRDILGNHVHQTGSNITTKRLRFDFNYDKKLSDTEIQKIEQTVNQKIKLDLPVHFEMIPLEQAKKIGAIGLFDEKYQDQVKVYFVGNYSKEFCGGPHVKHTGVIKNFTIIKQENIGHGQRRIYAVVG
ncbi:MAG: alanine--tRNA ligase [Candidatus Levyibacteriota bacterium]|nr:MAG: alanine--tRNA ligase [Candidatus Levybacteria bacterium]